MKDTPQQLRETVDTLTLEHRDTTSRFDALTPLCDRLLEAMHSSEEPRAKAELWCAFADALFYRQLIAFDAPEYDLAIQLADKSGDAELRVRTRLVAGRALLEVRPPEVAAAHFEQAIDLEPAGILYADALRGLGWTMLARGDTAAAERLFREAYDDHQTIGYERGVADASMALATLDALAGRKDDADLRCFRAQAIFLAQHDSVRLAKLASLRAALGVEDPDLPATQLVPSDLIERRQWWRAALALARSFNERDRKRARVLADMSGVAWEHLEQSLSDDSKVVTGWRLRRRGAETVLTDPSGEPIDITRLGPQARMVRAFADAIRPLSVADLFRAGWPDTSVQHEAATRRVYTTIRRLRALGLPVIYSGDGYSCEMHRG